MSARAEDLFQIVRRLFTPHPWHGVSIGAEAPEKVNVFVEIVPTDTIKYEIDKTSGFLKVDRPQRYSNVCPAIYGFIPQTYCGDRVGALCSQRTGRPGIKGDGDPLDICVLSEKVVAHGNVLLEAVPIGGLRMIDGDQADDKILAVMKGDAVYGDLLEVADASPKLIDRLRHYFLTYKDVPGGRDPIVEVAEVYDREAAHEVIRRCREDYLAKFGDLEKAFAETLRAALSREESA